MSLRTIIASVLMVAMLTGASVALAQVTPGQIPTPIDGENISGDFQTVSGWVGLLIRVVQWIYTILFIVAVLFILLAAFNFVTSKGDPGKVDTAKQQLLYAVVGIAVGLLSVIVVTFVRNTLVSGGF